MAKLSPKERERLEIAIEMKERGLSAEPKEEMGMGEAALVSGARGLTLGFSDEIAGAIAGAYTKSQGGDYDEAYKKTRDWLRGKQEEASETHPVVSFASEMIGGIPLFAAGGVPGAVVAGAAAGAGEARELEDVPAGMAMGGALGGATGTAGKVIGSIFSKPGLMRAKRLGLQKKTAQKMENRSSEQIIDEISVRANKLNDIGLFKAKNAKFDVETGQFTGGKSKKLIGPSNMEIETNMDEAIKSSSKKIEEILKGKEPDIKYGDRSTRTSIDMEKPSFTQEDLLEFDGGALNEAISDFPMKDQKAINELLDESVNELTKGNPAGEFSLMDLHNERKRLYKYASDIYSKKEVDVADKAKALFAKKLAGNHNEMIGNFIQEPKYKKLNETMSDMFEFKQDVRIKAIEKELGGDAIGATIYGQDIYKIQKGIETVIDPTRKMRAGIGEA